MTGELPPAAGYRYALPEGWLHIDLHPRRRELAVRRAVRARVRRDPRLAPHLARLDRLFQHEAATAAATGARRISLLAEEIGPAVVTAAVTFVVERRAGPALTATEVAEALRAGAAVDPAEVAEVAEVAVVPLIQQDAVRRVWTDRLAGADEWEVPHRIWQLVAPWPGRSDLALLTMSSACRPLWPILGATFDACLSTFHWTWESPAPDMPAPPDMAAPPDAEGLGGAAAGPRRAKAV